MQNDLEERVRVRYVHARKNEIEIIKKIMSRFFVGILIASVLIGILTVIPGPVGAKTWLHNPAALASVYGLTAQPRAETWSIETVDSDGDVGRYTSIALDSNGYLHISYLDDTNRALKYAKWTGTGWSIETVDSDSDVGRYTSIVLDSNDYPHISYFDDTNQDLKYVKWTGTGWIIETVDSDGDVGKYTSIALDSNGYPYISYFDDTNKDLKYVKWTGAEWNIKTVDSDGDVGRYTSIALDSNGYQHISYYDDSNKDLKYVKWTGTGWIIKTADSEGYVGGFTSIALNSKGYPHISYYDENNRDLKYVKWTGTGWSIETVDSDGDVGRFTSIALDSSGYPHISYLDYTNSDSKYAKWTGTVWSIETVDPDGDVARVPSIVLDSNDYPHISYRDYTNRDLKYAKLMPDVQSSLLTLSALAGDKYVDLSWTPPSDGGSAITEYKIYRGTSSGGESYHDSVSTPSYNDTTVTNGQTYYYHVTAINVAGESSPSNEVPAEPRGPPGSPRNINAAAGDSYVKLEWFAPSDVGSSEITNYNVYRGTTPGGETLLKTVGNVLIYTDSDVTSNQKYYYRVSAVNSVGEGKKSNEVNAMPTPTPTATITTPLPTHTPTTPLPTYTPTTPLPTHTPTTTPLPTYTPTTTPLPTHTPTTPTPSFQELIDEALKELPMGRILFNPPKEMKVRETELVEVRITQNLTEDLTKGLEGPGEPQINETKVSTYMKVRLTGRNFAIYPEISEPQMIESDKYTHWEFHVTPLKSGIQTLKLTYFVIISVQGTDRQKEYKVGDWEVSVKVTPMGLLTCDWQFIVTTIISVITIIPILVWLFGRRRKKSSE